jgi:hypothetical protein
MCSLLSSELIIDSFSSKMALPLQIPSWEKKYLLTSMILHNKLCFNLWKISYSNILDNLINKDTDLFYDICDLLFLLKHGFIIAYCKWFRQIP